MLAFSKVKAFAETKRNPHSGLKYSTFELTEILSVTLRNF